MRAGLASSLWWVLPATDRIVVEGERVMVRTGRQRRTGAGVLAATALATGGWWAGWSR